MKKLYIPTLLICIFFNCSCNDFLETSSKDLIIPTEVSHYKELLQGEAYFKELFSKTTLPLYMTDDVEYFDAVAHGSSGTGSNAKIETYQYAFKWDAEIEHDMIKDEGYQYLYKQIMTANVCLDAIDEMKGSEKEKMILKGQASFTRAYGYFILANLYAQAYNEAKPDDPCVPLVLNPTPTLDKFPRATIEQVWHQIKSDNNTAIESLKDIEIKNIYEIDYKAPLVLGMRIALFMEDFDAAVAYGEEILKINNNLYDITNKNIISMTGESVNNFIYPDENKEILWLFDNGYLQSFNNLFGGATSSTADYISVSSLSENSLISQYKFEIKEENGQAIVVGDHRPTFWFYRPTSNNDVYKIIKYDSYDYTGESYQSAFRTGEVYITLAEAYARKSSPDIDKALYYLNTLRSNRIDPYVELTAKDFTTAESLRDFIWQERRRELCFEEHHRWWDLRRTGQPALTHYWRGGEVYRLEEKDPAYILNFPEAERYFNSELNNPRPIRNATH